MLTIRKIELKNMQNSHDFTVKIRQVWFFLLEIALILALSFPPSFGAEGDYSSHIVKFRSWLLTNRDLSTGLPISHVGDERFQGWAITYDSAITTLAYLASARVSEAKKIIDFYINTPQVWRLDIL